MPTVKFSQSTIVCVSRDLLGQEQYVNNLLLFTMRCDHYSVVRSLQAKLNQAKKCIEVTQHNAHNSVFWWIDI